MRMEGRHTYAASREVVWGLLYDPLVLERILPGCEAFEGVAADEYRVTLDLRVGPINDRFVGTLRLDRVVPFGGFEFQADGESPNGLVNSRGRITLQSPDATHTVLAYEADIYVGGRLATVTSRMLETTARAFARRALEALETQVGTRTRIYTTSVAAPPLAEPSPTGTTIARLAGLRRIAVLLGSLLAFVWLARGIDRRRTRRLAREVATLLAQRAPDAMPAEPAEVRG